MESAIDYIFSLLKSGWISFLSVKDRIKRLEDIMETVKLELTEAQQIHSKDDRRSKLWLHRLKSLYFDIDRAIDLYHTTRQQEAVSAARSSRKRKRYQIGLPIINPNFFLHRRIASKIDRINRNWELFKQGEKEHRHITPVQPSQPVQFVFHEEPIGRIVEKREIIDLLVSDLNQENYQKRTIPVVPIYGTAGIGKTTLARLVYKDPAIESFFKLKAWVHLNISCNITEAMKAIYEQLTGEDSVSWGSHVLGDKLREHLHLQGNSEDKLLLVLDNVWIEDYKFWNAIQYSLFKVAKGSKILITTRSKSSCRVMSAISRTRLSGLHDDECWQLLESVSLMENTEDISEKRIIGKEIATRCQGCPMAVHTIGKLLIDKPLIYWSIMLREMRFLRDDGSDVLMSLKASYDHLDFIGKQLFSYCCVFPNGYKFERSHIIRCWMGEGLIPPGTNNKPEEICRKYFDELLANSLFEEVPFQAEDQEIRYRMPILLSDLAKLVSEYEFRDLKSDNVLPLLYADEARYATLLHQRDSLPINVERILPYKNLRTFKLCDEYGERVVPLQPIMPQFFHKVRCLRVLDLSKSNLEYLPDSVGELIHLRYLCLSDTKIRIIPDKVCDLINLQTFELEGCPELAQLPEGMDRLINMRHLDLYLEWEIVTDSTELIIPKGLNKLKHLQTVSRFNVKYCDNSESCNISDLNDLELKGDLCLLNLERIPLSKSEDAMKVNLKGKELENIMLRWSDSAFMDAEQHQCSEGVAEHLEPNHCLRKLWFINYPGRKIPNWMCSRQLSRLNTIRISKCHDSDFLTHLELLPQLRNLQIDAIPAVSVSICAGFPSLEYFVLSNLYHLEELNLTSNFPEIKEVHVCDCPSLRKLVICQNLGGKVVHTNCPKLSFMTVIP